MKAIKFIIILLLLASAVCPVYAEHLPEDDLLNKELTVEKDTNVIKENADKYQKPENEEKNKPKTFIMSKARYEKEAIKPVITLTIIGLALYAAPYIIKLIKDNGLFKLNLPTKKK